MRTRTLPAALLAALLAAVLVSCRHEEPKPIQVRDVDLIVQNRTSAAWSNVEVWVNDFYRGLIPSIQPGQQLTVPLGSLVESYGRNFNVHRTPVYGVLVTARASDGTAVRLTWGKVRRR